MNLLTRQLEIPLVIWKNEPLSLHEKILLAALHALDEGEGVPLTFHDIGWSLHIPSQVAASIVQALGNRSLVRVVTARGRKQWLSLDVSLKKAIEHENKAPRFMLAQYYIQCLCLTYDLKMEYAEQIRVCPKCLRAVYLTPSEKKYVYAQSP